MKKEFNLKDLEKAREKIDEMINFCEVTNEEMKRDCGFIIEDLEERKESLKLLKELVNEKIDEIIGFSEIPVIRI